MATNDGVKSAIVSAAAQEQNGLAVEDLFRELGDNYQQSQISAAFWTLVRERQIALTSDRKVQATQSGRHAG